MVNELRSFVPQFSNEPGFTWYAIDVSGKNTGDKNYTLNAINFQLKDSENYVTAISPAIGGPEPMLTHTDIPPGQQARGWVEFKVGAGRTPVELLYRSFTGTTGSIPVSAAGVVYSAAGAHLGSGRSKPRRNCRALLHAD